MADTKKKADQGIKSSRKSKVLVTLLVVVMALIVVGYFVYISGVLPRLFTAVKVVETVDGVQETIEDVSVAEFDYNYYQVLNTYYYYGLFSTDEELDQVYDTDTGKTYREMLMDSAAEEIMNIVVVNEEAEENGYLEHSGASRYAQLTLDSTSETSKYYGYTTVDQFLQAQYGKGMSSRVFRTCLEREALTQEYENYVRQFVFLPTTEELEAAYEADPQVYQRVDFSYYYFAGEELEDGTYDITAAEEQAQAVADGATDTESFRFLVIEQLGEDVAELSGFTEGEDPSYVEGYSSSETDSMAEGFTDFLFDEDTKEGDTTVITNDSGAFVLRFDKIYTYDEATVSYRTLTLLNDAYSEDDATEESIAAGLASVQAQAEALVANSMDSLAFADLVKANSDSTSEIVTGGYNDGVAASEYEETDETTLTDRQKTLGQWLFDESRVAGDTLILPSDDSSYVTIYYFESNVPAWMYTAGTQIVTSMVNSWSNDILSDGTSYLIAYDLIERLS